VNQNRSIPAIALSDFADRLRQFMGNRFADGATRDADTDEPFNRLALELFTLQFTHNEAYRRLCDARGISAAAVSHWSGIPAVPTVAFKELELTSLPVRQRTAVFHSSGTTGQQPSRHFHGHVSMALYEESVLTGFQQCLLQPANRANPPSDAIGSSEMDFLILTPPPSNAPHSSLVRMFETVRRKFGSTASAFCGTVEQDGAWSIDRTRIETILRSSIRQRRPLFVLGTAFNYMHLLERFNEAGMAFVLPSGSRALETGGYKGRSRVLPKAELHQLIHERLGIPRHQIVCEYGMSELSSQAYNAPPGWTRNSKLETGNFFFPPWARVQIVSPETGRPVAEGETGLIRVFDLANVWSVLAIQTEDLGIRRADGFELLGRAAVAEPRGCSLMAVGDE
jgi:hypothetical protein